MPECLANVWPQNAAAAINCHCLLFSFFQRKNFSTKICWPTFSLVFFFLLFLLAVNWKKHVFYCQCKKHVRCFYAISLGSNFTFCFLPPRSLFNTLLRSQNFHMFCCKPFQTVVVVGLVMLLSLITHFKHKIHLVLSLLSASNTLDLSNSKFYCILYGAGKANETNTHWYVIY